MTSPESPDKQLAEWAKFQAQEAKRQARNAKLSSKALETVVVQAIAQGAATAAAGSTDPLVAGAIANLANAVDQLAKTVADIANIITEL